MKIYGCDEIHENTQKGTFTKELANARLIFLRILSDILVTSYLYLLYKISNVFKKMHFYLNLTANTL